MHCSRVFRSSAPSEPLPSSPGGRFGRRAAVDAAALDQWNGGSAPVRRATSTILPGRAELEGMLPGPVPGDVPMPMIATKDIGNYAAERLHARDFSGSGVQELHGQRDVSMKEVATIVGSAIGKPKLGYMQVPFMMLEPAMVQSGMSKDITALLIEMWKAVNSGVMKPLEPRSAKNTTPTSIETFVTEVFAPAYLSMAAKA